MELSRNLPTVVLGRASPQLLGGSRSDSQQREGLGPKARLGGGGEEKPGPVKFMGRGPNRIPQASTEALPPGLPCWLLPPSRHALPPVLSNRQTLRSDFEVRSSGIPRVAIWAEEAPPQNKAHGPMPPPLGGSPSVGTASGSRSSQSHFRDEEAEAQAGEASRRGASCSQRGRWNRTHSHILGCAVTGLFPFSCGRSSSGIWLCPLQGWLGGAM